MNVPKFFLYILTALLFAGCVTHRIDWAGRVGHYTLDQAIVEFGPPDQQARLSDGRLVAEWISRYPVANGGPDGGFRYHSPSFGPDSSPADWRESKLRLTFNPNSILTEWSKD